MVQVKRKNEKKNKDEFVRVTSPPPTLFYCFKCQTKIIIKWVIPSHDYSKKNYWNYWIDSTSEEDRNKHICNTCLKKLYYDKKSYWKTIKNPKKRKLLTVYIYEKKI